MTQLEVLPYPLTDRDKLVEAMFLMNDHGWKSKLVYDEPGTNQPWIYSLVMEKAGETVNLRVGDELLSIGNGVLMTREKYEQLFG